MTDFDQELEELVEDPLEALKAKADLLGITYHPSIGLDKLKAKVEEHLSKGADAEKPVTGAAGESAAEKRARIRKEALALVRVNVTCMNPFKKEWEGEIFTVANGLIGTVKKYVPFNTSEGYHVPRFILNVMRERQCQIFYTDKDSRGNKIRKGKLIKEFAIEELPALTPEELYALAQRQAMANSLS